MESIITKCRQCLACYKSLAEAPDTRRFKLNWIVLIVTNFLAGLGDFLTASSLHQFITEPADLSVRPGLGLTEVWYSVIVGILSLGQLAGAIMVGILSRYMLIKYLVLIALGLTTIGGVLYGIGRYGWMVLIGRFLIGLYQGAHMTSYRTYIGETSETYINQLPKEKQAKSTVKYTMITVTFGIGTLGVATGPVLSAVLAQFSSVDQYRWPGWFTAGLAALMMVCVICLMHEKRTDLKRTSPGKRECKPRALLWFITAGLMPIWSLTVLETLENPILSGSFGLGINLILGKLHVDNRLIYLLGAVILIAGLLILGDWQSIGGDPCNQFNNNLTVPANNVTVIPINNEAGTMTLAVTDCSMTCNTTLCAEVARISEGCTVGPDDAVCMLDDDEELVCLWMKEEMFLTLQWEVESSGAASDHMTCSNEEVHVFRIISNSTLSCEKSSCDYSNNTSECVCQAYSNVPGYSCFWNQVSRVTGERCDTCLPTCLSKTTSLYFAQFIVTLILLTPAYPIGRLSLTFLMSDCASGQSQGMIMASFVAVGALGRATGPLWANPTYLAVGRRTWLLMVILVTMQLMVLAWFILLCKQLKHKVGDSTSQKEGAVEFKVDEDAVQLLSYEQPAHDEDDNSSTSDDNENDKIL